MAEYEKEQKNLLSRAISNSETGYRQLKSFVDNRFNSFRFFNNSTVQPLQRTLYIASNPNPRTLGVFNQRRIKDKIKKIADSIPINRIDAFLYLKEYAKDTKAFKFDTYKDAIIAGMRKQKKPILYNLGKRTFRKENDKGEMVANRVDKDINSGIWIFNERIERTLKEKSNQVSIKFQRDHIIPLLLIQSFADIIFKTKNNELTKKGNTWLTNAINTFHRDATPHSKHYIKENGLLFTDIDKMRLKERVDKSWGKPELSNDYFTILTKAISWMPGNVFITPQPRANDTHDGLDLDRYAQHFIPEYNWNILKMTFDNMKIICDYDLDKKDFNNDIANSALSGLAIIATWKGPYPCTPAKWKYSNVWEKI